MNKRDPYENLRKAIQYPMPDEPWAMAVVTAYLKDSGTIPRRAALQEQENG